MKKIILISLMNSVFFFSFFAGALETSKALKKDYDEFKKEMSVKMDNLELKIAALKESAKVKADEAQTKALADLEHSRDHRRIAVRTICAGCHCSASGSTKCGVVLRCIPCPETAGKPQTIQTASAYTIDSTPRWLA